jgi:hypothetical protein
MPDGVFLYGAKMGNGPESNKLLLSGAETGFIAQNVYLYCASEGLTTVGYPKPSK